MLRRTYDWIIGLASHKRAVWALGIISFIESSIFPIPPDALLIPMALARPRRAWLYAFVCTVTSVLGGLMGYAIGWGLYETVAEPLLAAYGYDAKFSEFTANYNQHGAAIVLFAGLTPFPYKVITIASGASQLSLGVFLGASILARGLRFFLIAALLYWFGPPIRRFVETYLGWVCLVGLILLIGGFAAIKFFPI